MPLGWIFGSGNSQNKPDNGSNSLGDNGKNNAHLPEMLEDNDIIEDSADSAVSSGGAGNTDNTATVVPSATTNIKSISAGDSTSTNDNTVPTEAGVVTKDKVTTRTWYDWVTWK